MTKDPVCGMTVDQKSAFRYSWEGREYFFCSAHCRDKFIREKGLSTCGACVPVQRKPFYLNKLFITATLAACLLVASLIFTPLAAFRSAFLTYIKAIWWAVALGLLLGGAIDYYIPREYVSKILAVEPKSAIVRAVLLGFLMSACSHGILALSIQLHKKGASNPAVVSFLLASPWANLTITVMLVALFGLKGILIILAAIIIALNTGFIYILLEKKGLVEKNANTVQVASGFSVLEDVRRRYQGFRLNHKTIASGLKGTLEGAASLADMVLWWIIIGMLLASLAQAFIPQHFFHKFMGSNLTGLLVTLALATVIEVCSEGSSPLAFEIYRSTKALGNSFVFLMAGVVTDYTEIGLLWTNVGKRVALWLPLVTVPQVLIAGYLMNIIFR